jgi:hypothetical protein
MKSGRAKPKPGAPAFIAARGIEISRLHIVGLCDPETGQVVHRHTICILNGGREVSEADAIETTMARARAFYAKLERNPTERRKTSERGQKLLPLDQAKAVVSSNPSHLAVALKLDLKSGKLVENKSDVRMVKTVSSRG